MTKVEELRARLIDGRGMLVGGARDLDAFESSVREDALQQAVIDIARARSEGKAEGAVVGVSAARRQLRAASASVTKQEGTRSINEVRHYLIPVRAFSVPIASVLAPTKESYAECLRDSVTDEINGEDVDPTPD